MRKFLFILLFCLLSCQPQDPSVIKIHRHFALPTLTVIIKGKSVEMIMDTGGAVTIIDDDLARELGILPQGESIEITGYGGARDLLQAEETLVTLGEHVLKADVYISDTDNITRNKRVKGILGIDHLHGAVIDLEKNTITIE
jgi:hypothetical protein